MNIYSHTGVPLYLKAGRELCLISVYTFTSKHSCFVWLNPTFLSKPSRSCSFSATALVLTCPASAGVWHSQLFCLKSVLTSWRLQSLLMCFWVGFLVGSFVFGFAFFFSLFCLLVFVLLFFVWFFFWCCFRPSPSCGHLEIFVSLAVARTTLEIAYLYWQQDTSWRKAKGLFQNQIWKAE